MNPIYMKNPKYQASKKNDYQPPRAADSRLEKIKVGCGRCPECRKQKANHWKIRLLEEFKGGATDGIFVTLTFSDKWGERLAQEAGNEANKIAILAVKRFRERYRKKYGVSIKHWLITELGHEGKYHGYDGKIHEKTQRLHMHGILWTNKDSISDARRVNDLNIKAGFESSKFNNIWMYGKVNIGYTGLNEKMISYCTKYMLKTDQEHKGFTGRVLCSPGIGKEYLNSLRAKVHEYKEGKTDIMYKCDNGKKIGLPKYYKEKLYKDNEKESIRLSFEDKGIEYAGGREWKVPAEYEQINNINKKNRASADHASGILRYEWRNGNATYREKKKKMSDKWIAERRKEYDEYLKQIHAKMQENKFLGGENKGLDNNREACNFPKERSS